MYDIQTDMHTKAWLTLVSQMFIWLVTDFGESVGLDSHWWVIWLMLGNEWKTTVCLCSKLKLTQMWQNGQGKQLGQSLPNVKTGGCKMIFDWLDVLYNEYSIETVVVISGIFGSIWIWLFIPKKALYISNLQFGDNQVIDWLRLLVFYSKSWQWQTSRGT